MKKFIVGCLLACAILVPGFSAAADTIKLGLIDPLSGSFALDGRATMLTFRALIQDINAKGGILGGRQIELVTFDNKSSPQESILALKQVVSQGTLH